MKAYQINPSIDWEPALGPELNDHPWGSICINEDGEAFLIGDAVKGHNLEFHAGRDCILERVSASPIAMYAVIIEQPKEESET